MEHNSATKKLEADQELQIPDEGDRSDQLPSHDRGFVKKYAEEQLKNAGLSQITEDDLDAQAQGDAIAFNAPIHVSYTKEAGGKCKALPR